MSAKIANQPDFTIHRPSCLLHLAILLMGLMLLFPGAAQAEEGVPYEAIHDALSGTLREDVGEFSAVGYEILGETVSDSQVTVYLKVSASRWGFMGGYCIPLSGWQGPCTVIFTPLNTLWLLNDVCMIESILDIGDIFPSETAALYLASGEDYSAVRAAEEEEARAILETLGRDEPLGTYAQAAGEMPNVITIASNLLSFNAWPLTCTTLEAVEAEGRMLYTKSWTPDNDEEDLVTTLPDGRVYHWGGTTGTLSFTKSRKDSGEVILTITARATLESLTITVQDSGGLTRYVLPIETDSTGQPGYCQPTVTREGNCSADLSDIERACQDLPGERRNLTIDISRSALETLYPGWTLAVYEKNDSIHEADAVYCRTEDNRLYCRVARISAESGILSTSDCLPVPVGVEGDLNEMASKIALGGSGTVVLAGIALDNQSISLAGEVLCVMLQTRSLVILSQEEGTDYLTILEQNEEGQTVVLSSGPIPGGTSLDTLRSADGEIVLEGAVSCCFARSETQGWCLKWVRGEASYYQVTWFGLQVTDASGTTYRALGTFPVFGPTDMQILPVSAGEALSLLDTSLWAVVTNPDPAETLNLRASPDKKADSLGQFYNGTPVRILEDSGDWCRVIIGASSGMEGWMMKQYLSFGESMQDVEPAFPEKAFMPDSVPPEGVDSDESQRLPTGSETIIGFTGQDTLLYILLTPQGDLFTAPQVWYQ